jgi:hypothetical protein
MKESVMNRNMQLESEIKELSFQNEQKEKRIAELIIENKELHEALIKIKTLQSIIPICAVCRRIHDDQDSWKTLEEYIVSYSNSQFSHTICPECSDQYYGKELWYEKFKTYQMNKSQKKS